MEKIVGDIHAYIHTGKMGCIFRKTFWIDETIWISEITLTVGC
jgi:hypothetical protein